MPRAQTHTHKWRAAHGELTCCLAVLPLCVRSDHSPPTLRAAGSSRPNIWALTADRSSSERRGCRWRRAER